MGAASRAFSAGRKPPKHAPKGTLEGGQFIGRASITHALIRKLLGMGEDRQQGSAVGRFTSRGGSVASIALHPRRPRIDDRVRDPRTGKLGRVQTLHADGTGRVAWDDGQVESRHLGELEDPYAQRQLPDPERTFHAERGPRAAQVDPAVTTGTPGRPRTAAERMRDGIAAGKAIGRDRQRALDIAAGRKPRPTSAEIDDRIRDLTGEPGAPDLAPKTGPAPAKKASRLSAATLSADPTVRAVQVENRIRAAYAAQREPGEWLGLADLREQLGDDVTRDEADAALRKLLAENPYRGTRGADVRIIPVANSKALKPRDREAALRIGDEDSHAILLQDTAPRPLPTPAKKATAAQRMSQAAKPPARTVAEVAAVIRRNPSESQILDELKDVRATDLRALADELNVSLPATARSAGARKLYLAQTVSAHQRRTGGQAYVGPLGRTTPDENEVILKALNEGRDAKTALAEYRTVRYSAPAQSLAAAKMARGKAPSGPRPSGLPTDRKATTTDFEDLAVRVSRLRTAEQRHAVLADLNATELNALARQFPGDPARTISGTTSDRRTVLKIPAGLSIEERRRWLAERLAPPQ